MRSSRFIPAVICLCAIAATSRASTVSVSLLSSIDGHHVVPGTAIPWSIQVQVSDDDNYGLALISVDLLQDAWNPEPLDIPQAESVPEEMGNFDRPHGLANPPPAGATSGYLGTPVYDIDRHGLSQIGGAQNTFGTVSKSGADTFDIIPGVGQAAEGQVITSGVIPGPMTPGTYRFRISEVVANTLKAVYDPPAFSPTTNATVVLNSQEIVIYVCTPGDIAGDGDAGISLTEVEAFVQALLDPDAVNPSTVCAADINADGVTDGRDVAAFVEGLIGGIVATPPPAAGRVQNAPKDQDDA